MSITPSTNLRMQFSRSGRKPRENNMRNYYSTRVPVSGFTQASGNSEWWKMTGQADNVAFLATESGVKRFQLSLWGCFMLSEDRLEVLDAGHLHRQRWLRGVQPSSFTPCHLNRRRAISGQQTKQPSALRRKPALRFVARPGQRGRPVEVTPCLVLHFAPSVPQGQC